MGNKLEQEIINLYSKDISSSYSINQIAAALGKRYPYINKKVSLLIKTEIFRKVVVGKSHLCSVNLANDEAIYLLILNEIAKKKQALASSAKLSKAASYLDKAKKASGARIVIKSHNIIYIVLDNACDDKKIFLEKSLVEQNLHGYHAHPISKDDFCNLLLEDKRVQEDHVIFSGYEEFYALLREFEDQLRIRYSRLI